MLVRYLPILLAIFLTSSLAAAQGYGTLSLHILVVLDGENLPTDKEIVIALLDEWSAIENVQSTNRGMVHFFTKPGIKRIRITGADIEQFDTEFNTENMNLGPMTFVVTRRMRALPKMAETEASVAVVRLRIPGKAKQEFKKAEEALEKKNLERARSHLRKAIAIYPDYDLAYGLLATVELMEGQRNLARQHLEKAVALNDRYTEVLRRLASLYLDDKRYQDAELLLRKALTVDPNDAWSLSFAALAAFQSGALDQAVATANRLHSLPHEEFASAHLIAARALEGLNRSVEAIVHYSLYLMEAPNGPNAAHAREGLARLGGLPQ